MLLSVNRVQPQRCHVVTREIIELGQLVSDDTGALVIACCLFEDADLLVVSTANIIRGFGVYAFLLRKQHGSEVAAVGSADTPWWCCRVPDEYVLGDVARNRCGGLIEVARDHGLARDALPRCGFVQADRHLRVLSARWVAGDGFHPDPDLEPPRVRPEHPEKLDDRTGQVTAGDTARLGYGSQPVRPAAAGQDRWCSYFDRG